MKDIVDIIEDAYYIVEGYLTWLINIITGKTKEKAKKRLAICNECEFNQKGICQQCGCVIKAKVRVNFDEDEDGFSIDGCPEVKW